MSSVILEVAAGPLIGAALGELVSLIIKVKDNAGKLKATLEDLKTTLDSLSPLIIHIEKQPNAHIQKLTQIIKQLIEEAKVLVSKCSNLRWWSYCKKSSYQQKLATIHNSFLRLLFLILAHTKLGADAHHHPNTSKSLVQKIKSEEGGLLEVVGGGGAEEFVYEYWSAEWKVNNTVIFKTTMEELEANVNSLGGSRALKKDNGVMLRGAKKEVEATMKAISPAIMEEIELYSKEVMNGKGLREMESIKKMMKEKDEKLINEYSNDVKCCCNNCGKRTRNQKKLMELDNEILKFHNLHFQAHMTRSNHQYLNNNAVKITEIIQEEEEIKEINEVPKKNNVEELVVPADHDHEVNDGSENKA